MIIFKGIRLPKIQGITLFPFILLSAHSPSKTLINHERRHIRQQLELLLLPFYIWYAVEWMVHYFKIRNFWAAYRLISFEKEAYQMEHDLDYLKHRKLWSFLNYL